VEDLIGILYTESGCNHSPEVTSLLENIVNYRLLNLRNDKKLVKIDRWNIYQPDKLHIVYFVEVVDYTSPGRVPYKRLESAELICPISDFISRWRESKLDKLGI
jgi:hypothetical protein